MPRPAAALILSLVALAATPPAALAQAGAAARSTAALPPPGVVDGKTGKELALAGARIVDVRSPEEFAAGHVPGAINVPYDQIGKRAAELGPKDTPILLYCRSGRRSAIAADALRGLGYEKLWDMQRLDAWPGP